MQSNLLLGAFISGFAGFVPISVVGEMTSIGTLLAFVLVCAGILILRKTDPDAPRSFRTPWVPVVPVLRIGTGLVMMVSLPWATWVRLFAWLALGLAIYYGYGREHSKLGQQAQAARGKSGPL